MTISSDYLNDVLFNDARHMVEELQFLHYDYQEDLWPHPVSTEDAEFSEDDQDTTYYESTR